MVLGVVAVLAIGYILGSESDDDPAPAPAPTAATPKPTSTPTIDPALRTGPRADRLAGRPRKPGTIFVEGTGRRSFGPFDFPAAGRSFKAEFVQYDNAQYLDWRTQPALEISYASDPRLCKSPLKRGVKNARYATILQMAEPFGQSPAVLDGGGLYLCVEGSASYVIRLTPLG